MDKVSYVVGILVDIRESIDDLIDELVPPPSEETIEQATSEAPPKGRSARRKVGRSHGPR